MGTGPFPGLKRPGRGVDHPPPSSAEVKERIDLYLYFLSGASWSRANFTFILLFAIFFRPYDDATITTYKGTENATLCYPKIYSEMSQCMHTHTHTHTHNRKTIRFALRVEEPQ